MNKLLKYTFMLLCCFLLMGCLPLDKETDKKSIVCTTYAQYNWLQEIIGENNSTFELTLLIKDGADLHSYQPTIQDLAKVSSADLFVYVGGESEQWVSDALKEAKNKNMLVVDMMDVLKERIKEEEHVEGMKEDHDENEDESEYDEHVWLSLINAHEVVRSLSNEVQKLDDVHKKTYEENTIRYLNDIDDLNHQYEQVVEINLSEVRPTVAFPHLPGNGHTIDEIEEMDKIYIDQVVIGSCTNGRLSDLEKAAAILKGKKVADNVRVMVVPATQKIFLQCIQKGLAEIFVEAGCAFNTPSCGPCMGGHMGVMAKGEKCVSTTNRNFVGRMGDTEALIYLASPQVAAASAIAGYIANPEKVGKE